MEIQERTIVFAGFGDKMRTVADAATTAQLLGFGPDHEAGIETGVLEHEGEPSRSCAFPMSTADGDSTVLSHQRTKQLGILDDGRSASTGFDQLGVLLFDRGGCDDQLDIGWNGFGGLGSEYFCAAADQPVAAPVSRLDQSRSTASRRVGAVRQDRPCHCRRFPPCGCVYRENVVALAILARREILTLLWLP